MKHLKSYNESVTDDLVQDLKDICLDLTDENYYEVFIGKVSVNADIRPWQLVIEPKGKKTNPQHDAMIFNELLDNTIRRIIHYMKIHKYICIIRSYISSTHYKEYSAVQFINKYKEPWSTKISITFNKT